MDEAIAVLWGIPILGVAVGFGLGLWLFRPPRKPRLWESTEVPPKSVRRGRGFTIVEAANLASWGIKVRPEELEPPAGDCEWKEATMLGKGAEYICVLCGRRKTVAPAKRVRNRWWDQKRGIWRDEETGRKAE